MGDSIIVITGKGPTGRSSKAVVATNAGALGPADLAHASNGDYVKLVIARQCRGGGLVVQAVQYWKKKDSGQLLDGHGASSLLGYQDVTEKIKQDSKQARTLSFHACTTAIERALGLYPPGQAKTLFTKLLNKAAVQVRKPFESMRGYLHWYSELEGVYRPCANGFAMIETLDRAFALEIMASAIQVAQDYLSMQGVRAPDTELVLAVAFRFLSGPYGEEITCDDRSLWGVMTDRKEKDCDDLSMVACAVVDAVKREPTLPDGVDPAIAYLASTFRKAYFVQGEATPNVAQCPSGGHCFMMLERASSGGSDAAPCLTNALLVECTTPMGLPGFTQFNDKTDSEYTVAALKKYDLNKYTAVVALYTATATYFARHGKSVQHLGVPATDLIAGTDPSICIEAVPPLGPLPETIEAGQEYLFYEQWTAELYDALAAFRSSPQTPACRPGVATWSTTDRGPCCHQVFGGMWAVLSMSDCTQSHARYRRPI